jgi:CelD/BcsL family acetyltransferase involved in cellulose biosynthesis
LIDLAGLRDEALLSAWRGLAVLRENPFLTPEWFRIAVEVLPEEAPFAIAWWSGDELRGVLPLVAASVGPMTVLRFPNHRRGDWFGPLCRPEDEVAMAAQCADLLEREGHAWDAIRLDRVDLDSAWPEALARHGAKMSVGPRRRSDVLPYIEFDDAGYEGYLASRSRNFRSQLGRRRRRLERENGLSFRITATPAELEADLDTFFRLHDERWDPKGGSTMGSSGSRDALRRFAAATQELGWLRLWIAEVDGEPAAAWYGWRIGDRYCYALAGFAARYEQAGLGGVMLAHTIEAAAAEGAAIYDLMWGDEGYKERFETGRRNAGTWLIGGSLPTRTAISAGVHSVQALEALPPGVREPLRRVRRALRRS